MQPMIRGLALVVLLAVSTAATAASTLTSLDFRQGSDGALEVDLDFRGPVPEVRGYRLDDPARLTIDLMDTDSVLERRLEELGIGGVERVTALQAGSRTRLVFELDGPLPYDTRQQGDRLRLLIGGGAGQPAAAPSATSPSSATAVSASPSRETSSSYNEPSIQDIDFRRGDDGAGRLVVTFDRAGVDARVRESGRNRIVAELRGVELPASLDQVYDVSDFGTPLRRVTPRIGRDGVTLEIEGSGDFAMLSTQSGRQLTIEAQPVTQAEREERVREQFPYTGERITLNFQDIEVRSVLAIIADFTGLNLVASDSVTGRVTLNLEDVPWDQALDLVLKSHGLASRQDGNVIVVAPASELARMERQELEAREQMETLAPLTSEFIQVKYAKADDLAALLRSEGGFGLLSERGRVAVDPRTNTLLVQDTADQIDSIMQTLQRLDVAVRQVQIEARIVIARDSATRELGVNWGLSSPDRIGDSRFDVAGAATGSVSNGGLAVDMGGTGTSGTGFSFGYLSGDILLDLELRALESEGKSQTISQPRVITANQRKAVIKQGTQIPFQEASSSGATNVEFEEAVLALEVTPQITPDNRIIMDLVINNDTVGELFNGVPSIDTNEIETQVLVDNGETVVLGGILTTEEVQSLLKTPFFGDLPVIGNLFRYTENTNDKVELLVFITPRILDDNLAIR
ncbi:type IV pilus secretin PilQ [Halomonas lysinitropha]|uniref:Type IV pilus biogenesis and competence protein PilQ n=1 Tax=Halomonas lysinitropha TaxID=2607506 RepID=A0A5K1I377_9GAMM|nr:type IV pilus secretin PilQ [Halomonas lysinitropha]VVZ95885.1 Type IV pilus biogenesis and competence protein PilQ precursor [Halomonas lysinitropha]